MTKPAPNSAEPRNKGGRKTTFTPDIAAKVCEHIANGMSLSSIEKLRGMPPSYSVIRWLAKGERGDERYSDFSLEYAHARAASGDAAYEHIRDYERRLQLPRLTEAMVDGKRMMVPTPGYLDANVGRTLIDSAKWRASKLKPKVYGDRLELAGKVGTTSDLVEQAPDWLKEAIKDKAVQAELEAAREADRQGAPQRDGKLSARTSDETVH